MSIQPNELRIGNWVLYEGRYFKIHVISPELPSLETDEFGIGVVGWKNLEPIPLTEDILVKCGAEAISISGQSWVSYKVGDFIYDLTDPQLSRGLHWFQNYHYFRTGEELNINL